jgi:hypothetical protein
MAKLFQQSVFKIIFFIIFFSFNPFFSETSAQSALDIDIYAIIDTDTDNLSFIDNDNKKTIQFSIKGIADDNEAERFKSNFLAFGGIYECNYNKSDINFDIYNFNLKLYEKVQLNFFIKMLVTFNINYTMYKGVLTRTEELRKTSKINNNN